MTAGRRVVITGVGAISSVGIGAEALWDALVAARSGAARRTLEGLGDLAVFPVDGLDEAAEERFGRRDVRRMDRAGMLAALAGAMALDDAGAHGVPMERVGLALGCVHGGAATALEAHRAFLERGSDRVSPLSVPLSLTNGAGAAAARARGGRGPSTVVTTAGAAGTDAIGSALDMIRAGRPTPCRRRGGGPALAGHRGGIPQDGRPRGSARPADEVTRPFDRGATAS